MRRVMVVGQPGSGKSTFARALGARTGLPVIHLDRFHWAPGWVQRPPDEGRRLALEAAAGEAWIIESNYSATWPERAARADLVVWLDRPVALRLWRVSARLGRWLGRVRPDGPDGCAERIGGNTVWLYAYIWRTRRTGRDALARMADAAPCPVVRLASDRAVAAFLASRPPA